MGNGIRQPVVKEQCCNMKRNDVSRLYFWLASILLSMFSALKVLLVGYQNWHPACKKSWHFSPKILFRKQRWNGSPSWRWWLL